MFNGGRKRQGRCIGGCPLAKCDHHRIRVITKGADSTEAEAVLLLPGGRAVVRAAPCWAAWRTSGRDPRDLYRAQAVLTAVDRTLEGVATLMVHPAAAAVGAPVALVCARCMQTPVRTRPLQLLGGAGG